MTKLFTHRPAQPEYDGESLVIERVRAAVAQQPSAIEIDVRLTKDGMPVVAHDRHIGGRFRGRPIKDLTLKELESTVCRLEACLEAVEEFDVQVYLEVKDTRPGAARAAGAVALERIGERARFVALPSRWPTLDEVKAAFPEAHTAGVVIYPWTPVVSVAQRHGWSEVVLGWKRLNPFRLRYRPKGLAALSDALRGRGQSLTAGLVTGLADAVWAHAARFDAIWTEPENVSSGRFVLGGRHFPEPHEE